MIQLAHICFQAASLWLQK